jgi:hypothetical protein
VARANLTSARDPGDAPDRTRLVDIDERAAPAAITEEVESEERPSPAKVCGEGKFPKTFLLRGQPVRGQRL